MMTEHIHEKIKECNQILEIDLKSWLRHPTTKMFFEMVELDIARRKKLMADDIDKNDYEATELKINVVSNRAARVALDDMINPASITNDFEHYNFLIKEEDSEDEA